MLNRTISANWDFLFNEGRQRWTFVTNNQTQSFVNDTRVKTSALGNYRLPRANCYTANPLSGLHNGVHGRLYVHTCIYIVYMYIRRCGRSRCTSVPAQCCHNDCNIMTPSYGKIVFISDLQLHSLNGCVQPTKRSCAWSRASESRLNRAQYVYIYIYIFFFSLGDRINRQFRCDDGIFLLCPTNRLYGSFRRIFVCSVPSHALWHHHPSLACISHTRTHAHYAPSQKSTTFGRDSVIFNTWCVKYNTNKKNITI